jgi:hypothetical protein
MRLPRVAWVAAALIVGALALLAWRPAPPLPAPGPVGAIPAAVATAPPDGPTGLPPGLAPAPTIAQAARGGVEPQALPRAQPAAAASAAPARTHWDLCDIGRIPVPHGASPDEPPRQVFSELVAGLAQPMAESLAGAGPRAQAAARRLGLAPAAAGEKAGIPLAMAEASPDPVISAWAAAGCRGDAACLAAVRRRWQQLEPDNLAPRLLALQPGAAVDPETLQSMATARRHHEHWGQLGPALLEAWPAGQPRFFQVELLVLAIGVEQAGVVPPMTALVNACRDGAADAAVRDACQRIARTLLQHSDSMRGVGIGIGLGRVAGLPAAEIDAARSQLQAASGATLGVDEGLRAQPWSCASHAALLAWTGEIQRHGEWGALQRRLAAAPPPR